MPDESNEELESASLKYLSLAFISLIFVIIILAVGTQLVFSPEKVTTWVQSGLEETGLRDRLKEAKIKIEFKKAQTTLTGSLFYPIGVRLNDIKVSADRGCTQYATTFNTIVIPFGIVEILQGDFKLGTIKFSQGQTKETNVCQSQNTDQVNNNAADYDRSSEYLEKRIMSFDKGFRSIFESLQRKETGFSKAQGILVYDWSFIEKSKTADIELTVDRLKLYNLSGDLILKGEWGGAISFKKEKLDFDGEIIVSDEHMSFSSELKYKEGKAFVNHSYRRGEDSVFQTTVDNMPMSVFLSLFSLENKFSASFLRSSWLSLKLKLGLSKEAINLNLNSFDIKTEDGTMDLVSGVTQGTWNKKSSEWSLNKPVKFIFTNFKALNLLSLDVQNDLSKVLSNFGKFDLSLTVDEKLSVLGAFESSGQSLSIRSGGRLGVQNIISSLGDFSWNKEESFKVRLYQLKLERGEFEGEFVYTLDDRTTKLTADVKELSLNPSLWRDVFRVDSVGKMSIQGHAEVERVKSSGIREVTSEFTVLLSQVDQKLWTLEDSKFDCAYSEFLSCNLKFSKLSPRSAFSEWLEQEDRISLVEGLRNRGEVTLKNKELNLNLFYKKPYGGTLSLNWSIDQGPVLTFPNEAQLNLRSL